MRKRKIKNCSRKTSILLLSISILLWNCDKEELLTESSNEELVTQSFQYNFDATNINKELKLGKNNFQVNWNSYEIIDFDKSTMTATYEFDAFLNKEILNESDLLASKIIYKLIISDSKINPIYKVLRFEAFKSSENLNPSMKNTNNYDGMMFVLTGEGKIEDIIT